MGRNRFCIKTNGQIDAIVTIPYWVALLVSVLLFGMASIGVIITENPRDMVESVDESVKVDIEAITSFQTNISRIADDAKSLIKKIIVALNERNRICKVSKV